MRWATTSPARLARRPALVLSGFLGTVVGKHVLVKMNDQTFHRIISVILSLLALRLLYVGLSLLGLF